MNRMALLIGVLAPTMLGGCHQPLQPIAWPPPRPLGASLPAYQPPTTPTRSAPPAPTEASGPLTLPEALALALMHNPKLAATSWEIRLAEARTLQAALRPNPELEWEVEEALGSGDRQGFNEAEMTLRLSQLIELGDKRKARIRVALLQQRLAGWDYETQRLALLTDTTLGFIDVLAAQEHLLLAEEMVRLAEKTLHAVEQRVQADKASPLETIRAQVELANRRIALKEAQSRLQAARLRLASTWSSTEPQFTRARGTLEPVEPVPHYSRLQALIHQHPDLARWTEEMAHRLASLALERARRVPDLTVGLGLQRFEVNSDHALTFGFGLPLPVFDRNQGPRLEARYRLAQAPYQQRQAQVNANLALAESYQALTAARDKVLALRDQVVPAAAKTFQAAHEGYRQGRFDYLQVLDAQQSLFNARKELLDAQARYHRAMTIVESLIATPLNRLQTAPDKEP